MLEPFMDVLYTNEKKAQAQNDLVELMKQLPEEELHKIASGAVKVGYLDDHEGKWLDRFKGTPLFQQALEIEKQELENRMLRKQRRQEERELWREDDDRRDQLCIQRKLLELQLAEQEAGAQAGAEAGEDAGGVPPTLPDAAGEPAAQAPVAEAPAEAPPEEAAPETKAAQARLRESFDAMDKEARSIPLHVIERETVRRHAEAGKKKGRRLGAKSGGKGGAVTGAAGAGTAGLAGLAAAHKAGLLKGKGKGKVLAALAAAGAAGAGAGAGVGAARGGKRGERVGERLGRRAGHIRNIRRRQAILRAIRRQQSGRTKTSAVLTNTEAKEHLEDYFAEAIERLAKDDNLSRAGIANMAGQLAEEDATRSMKNAREVAAHPTKYRIRRGLLGATLGGAMGAGIGHAARGGKGALIGGLAVGGAGAALGAVPRPTGASWKNHAETTREALKSLKPGERKNFAGRMLALAVRGEGPYYDPVTKTSSVDPEALRDMQKEAIAGTVAGGLKSLVRAGGIGAKRLVRSGERVSKGYQKGGLKGATEVAGRQAKKRTGQLGTWAKKNPYQAAGAAGGVGFLAGRASS